MDEQIVCFKRDILLGHLPKSQVFYDETVWHLILNDLLVLSRSEAEKNERYKQLIAYILIRCGQSYFTYRRTGRLGDERLRQKYSIGFGGHINVTDTDKDQLSLFGTEEKGKDFILQAVLREIREELTIKESINKPEFISFINDDSNEVGKVHFGIVWLLKINNLQNIGKREKGMSELRFYDLPSLLSKKTVFETWSQLLIDHFIKRGI